MATAVYRRQGSGKSEELPNLAQVTYGETPCPVYVLQK